MKVKCVQSTFLDKHLFKANEVKGIEGLTLGKTYDAQVVGLVDGSSIDGLGKTSTRIRFLIFNDNGAWDTYQPELFTPAE